MAEQPEPGQTKDSKLEIYQGVLYKQGKIAKGWKDRFFVLYSDRRLAYFKNEDAWYDGKDPISIIDLRTTRSIAPTNKKNQYSAESTLQKSKTKSKRSLSRRWSIDFGNLFSSKSEGESDEEECDNEIAFIEMGLNQSFTFEIVQAKRTYNLATDNPNVLNKWLSKLETVTFGKKVYKGWLLKQSERNKKWDKRWFILYNTKEIRYYDDPTRAVSRGMAVLSKLKKVTKVEDSRALKKLKQQNVLRLEFQQRTLLMSCTPTDDRRVWFEKICRISPTCHFVEPIYEDYLMRFDSDKNQWKKHWFLLDSKCLLQFKDMDSADEYAKHAYFDEKEYNKAVSRYVMNRVDFPDNFVPKQVQKIRPGSNLQQRLKKQFIFVVQLPLQDNPQEKLKLFFATEKQQQLSRWFKKIRSLAGDEGLKKRTSQSASVSVMSESSIGDRVRVLSGRPMPPSARKHKEPGPRKPPKRNKNEQKILKMLQDLEADLKQCRRNINFVKECWEENNEGTESESRTPSEDEY